MSTCYWNIVIEYLIYVWENLQYVHMTCNTQSLEFVCDLGNISVFQIF